MIIHYINEKQAGQVRSVYSTKTVEEHNVLSEEPYNNMIQWKEKLVLIGASLVFIELNQNSVKYNTIVF